MITRHTKPRRLATRHDARFDRNAPLRARRIQWLRRAFRLADDGHRYLPALTEAARLGATREEARRVSERARRSAAPRIDLARRAANNGVFLR